jgi:hypothetical protein
MWAIVWTNTTTKSPTVSRRAVLTYKILLLASKWKEFLYWFLVSSVLGGIFLAKAIVLSRPKSFSFKYNSIWEIKAAGSSFVIFHNEDFSFI